MSIEVKMQATWNEMTIDKHGIQPQLFEKCSPERIFADTSARNECAHHGAKQHHLLEELRELPNMPPAIISNFIKK